MAGRTQGETCERLYDEHSALVYNFLRARLRNDQDAEDGTVETFQRVFASHNRFRGECSERAWVLKIALNVARRASERRNRRDERSLEAFVADGWEPQEGDSGDSVDASVLAQELLDGLPSDRRMAVWLRVGIEMSDQEVANVMGVPVGTIKSWVWRSLIALRKRLVEQQVEA